MDQYSEARTTDAPTAGATPPPQVAPGQTQVAELVDQAKETAVKTAENVGGMLQEQMDSGVHVAGQRLEGAVKNLHQIAGTFEQQGNKTVANLIERAAGPADRATKYLETTSAQEMLSDASRYARQHMWTVVVGGAVVGLMASRFLKASLSTPAARPSAGSYRG